MGGFVAWARLVVFALVLAVYGCEADAPKPLVTARYEPAKAGKLVPLTEEPPLAYSGDIPALGAARAEVIGSIEVRGEHGATEDALNAEARKIASERGGTHVLFVHFGEVESASVDGAATERARTGRAMAEMGAAIGCGMGDRQACVQQAIAPLRPPPATVYKTDTIRIAAYLVVRVQQERWATMPPALRPAPASARLPAEPR